MKTELSDAVRDTPEGRRADAVLRKCVHCGFCNATCPTYQLLGDELDGPRGRIYLIKSLLEGNDYSRETQRHLDRCLTCRSCETTCPSGVEYNRLLEIGRAHIDQKIARPWPQAMQRRLLTLVLPRRALFTALLGLGRVCRPLLPARLRSMIPVRRYSPRKQTASRHQRRVILLQGCVQPALSPDINQVTERLLDRLGIACIKVTGESCCGALQHHLGDLAAARRAMKNNIDRWQPLLDQGAEAILSTASGCGLMVKDYAEVLQDDADYADKARRVSEACMDIGEYLAQQETDTLQRLVTARHERLVFQAPCTLQHGQRQSGTVEALLTRLGVRLTIPRDPHLCCGSAGTYSILEPEISERLRRDKLHKLGSSGPDMILTANIGCQMHLQQASAIPVRHWISLFEEEAGQ